MPAGIQADPLYVATSSTVATTTGGVMTAVPAGGANGVALATPPAQSQHVRFYLPASGSISFTISTVAPTSGPTVAVIANVAAAATMIVDEHLPQGALVYITAVSGSCVYRYW